MKEHHLQVYRTARYHTIGDPAASEVWIVCHGYAQLARFFLRSFAGIDDGSRYVVAPEALNRYYFETSPGVHGPDARVAATWMTKEDREREIDDYIAYLDALAVDVTAVAKQRVVALGFSQGAATVGRWAARGTTHIDHVILWGSALPPELEAGPQLLRGASLTIAVGTSDEAVSPEGIAQQEARLRAGGMAYDLVRYDGGHRIEPDALMAIAEHVRATGA